MINRRVYCERGGVTLDDCVQLYRRRAWVEDQRWLDAGWHVNVREASAPDAGDAIGVLGFVRQVRPEKGSSTPFAPLGTHYVLRIPLWSIALLTATSLVWLRGNARIRPRLGRCANCGYDLRATPERCPECGAASARTAA
ncbi:MAG TPA: hypothetical protein VH475_07645 [Tepidisphaeraceae bacterium]